MHLNTLQEKVAMLVMAMAASGVQIDPIMAEVLIRVTEKMNSKKENTTIGDLRLIIKAVHDKYQKKMNISDEEMDELVALAEAEKANKENQENQSKK